MITTLPPRTSSAASLILPAQLVFNLGFYAVVPFLALVMTEDLGLGAAAVGLVLGARTASQQGMFLLGGVLADHWGPRRSIVTGCFLRAAGYLGLAASDSFWPFLLSAVVTGIGGAFFSPAVDAIVGTLDRARSGGAGARRSLFAWLVLFGEVGAVAGPLLGLALLPLGFPLVATAGACLFLAVGAALRFALPAGAWTDDGEGASRAPNGTERPGISEHGATRPETTQPGMVDPDPAGGAVTPGRWACLADRQFVLFCTFFSVNLLAYNQLYFALPLELDGARGGTGALALMFVLASTLTITLQLPASALAVRLGPGTALRAGFGCMALGFAAIALLGPSGALPGSSTPLLEPVRHALAAPDAALAGPVILVVLLGLGHMLAGPAGLQQVHAFAGDRPLGAYYGLLASAGGFAVLLGNGVIGAISDVLGRTAAWTVPALLATAAAVALPHLLPVPRPKESPCPVPQP